MHNGRRLPDRPASSTHALTAGVGFFALMLGLAYVRVSQPFGTTMHCALFLMGITAVAISLVDCGWQKVQLRASTGIDFAHLAPSSTRSATKYAGLLASLGFVALMYWLFPEYHGSFYDQYYAMLQIVVPVWVVAAIPYFYLIDRHMPEPHDGYWHMGMLCTLRWRVVDARIIKQHLLGWVIKGFFLPLMFTYLCNDISRFMAWDFRTQFSAPAWFDMLFNLLYLIDVGLVSMGYLFSLRLTDTHLRSAEPTALGWLVALVCYEPFWSLIGLQYLAYANDNGWMAWLQHSPVWSILWGSAILVLTAIYVWATVIFGGRFSNLTHRGIVTNGPYRWTKHPAYIAKNISWWLISVPFIAHDTLDEGLRHCLLLLGLNCIYWLRAKTEEWHLSQDPIYTCYARWIAENGLFRHFTFQPEAQ